MANPEHLALLQKGVKAWNEWREENPDVEVDLSGAMLYDTILSYVNLHGAPAH